MSFETKFYIFLGFWAVMILLMCLWINWWTKKDNQKVMES